MERLKLYFDVRDIFRAPRLGLSGKKIWVFLSANVIGFIEYWTLSYISLMMAGLSFTEAWTRFGLYPCLYGTPANWWSWLIYWIGIISWFYAIFLACTAVSRITYKQLKGNEFYSAGDSINFVKKHWRPVVFTPISLLLILTFFLLMAIIFALIGKITILGEILFAIPYLFYFFGSVFTIYTTIVLLISLIYTPAIVGTYEDDTMGTVFQSYSITWSQPWRIVAYHLVLLPIMGMGFYIFKLFWFTGFKLINGVFGMEWLMGEKLNKIVSWATDVVTPSAILNFSSNFHFSFRSLSPDAQPWGFTLPNVSNLSVTEYFAGGILAFFFFILILLVFSYALSILSVGETIMFVIFRNKSDAENLLERLDEDDEEDEDDLDTENEGDGNYENESGIQTGSSES
ncbi:MAG: hypothetical protein V3U16_04825 [Candidatus Neomarinimicrobiota bacterium]